MLTPEVLTSISPHEPVDDLTEAFSVCLFVCLFLAILTIEKEKIDKTNLNLKLRLLVSDLEHQNQRTNKNPIDRWRHGGSVPSEDGAAPPQSAEFACNSCHFSNLHFCSEVVPTFPV